VIHVADSHGVIKIDWTQHDVIALKPPAWEFPKRVDPKHSAAAQLRHETRTM